jgi:hypothetical protein
MCDPKDEVDESKQGPPWKWHIEETYKGLVTLSIEVFKLLALANGGACVALLTFFGNMASKGQISLIGNFKVAIVWYCSGLLATMLASIFAYYNQLRLFNEEKQRHADQTPKEYHRWLLGLTGGLVLLSVVAFACGSLTAAQVITLLR